MQQHFTVPALYLTGCGFIPPYTLLEWSLVFQAMDSHPCHQPSQVFRVAYQICGRNGEPEHGAVPQVYF